MKNALGACHPPSETTARRQPATLRRQQQHLRSSVPRQSPSRTVYNSRVAPREADLVFATLHTDPGACISSSQPPFAEVLRRPVESAQYAAASRLTATVSGIMGRPLSRAMTVGVALIDQRHCERSEAIQLLPGDDESWIASSQTLLAMTRWNPIQQTAGGYTFAFSRREAPELCSNSLPSNIEGAGKTGCALHPRSRVHWVVGSVRTRAYRFSGNTPAFPARWCYDL